MPRYNYLCDDCLHRTGKTYKTCEPLNLDELILLDTCIFEVEHGMDSDESPECPRCGGHNCAKTMIGTNIHGFIRGYGWSDRAGMRRDMNLYKLQNEDPYAQYRQPGEADHIKENLIKQGKHNPNTKYFTT